MPLEDQRAPRELDHLPFLRLVVAGVSEQVFVVTAVSDEKRGERLVVLYSGFEGDLDALLAKAKDLGLPGLWTPAKSSFHRVDAIPVLGTGKLDLKAVKELALKLEADAK